LPQGCGLPATGRSAHPPVPASRLLVSTPRFLSAILQRMLMTPLLLHLCWWVVLSIGNAELLVTLVNRIHSRPLPEKLLKEIRHLHDLLIPLFPSWMLVVIGFFGPAVLLNPVSPADTWAGLPLIVRVWFAICLLGFGGFCRAVLRYWLTRVPRQQAAFSSDVVDYVQTLGGPPVGPGPFQFMTKLPFNQCFEVEWTEREFRFERLPSALDGLTILHVTDLHFIGTIDLPFYRAIFERAATIDSDLIVFTGDLLDGLEFADWLPETIGKLDAPLGKYFILGNHDWHLEPDPIREAMSQLGWNDVSSRLQVLDIAGARLAIGGSELPWMGRQPDFAGAPEDSFRLFLSHSPDNIQWARRHGVDLMLSGHNHGGQVVLPIIGPVYSPSIYGCRYAGGVYFEAPTLLSVSRGISGRHPLRVGARPEIGRLTLRAMNGG